MSRKQQAPLTPEQQAFAAEHHSVIYSFLRQRRLTDDYYYDIVVFGYIQAVRRYNEDEALQQYAFSTIAFNAMATALGNERRRERRQLHPLSLDYEDENGRKLYDFVPAPEFLPGLEEDGIMAEQYAVLLDVLTERQRTILSLKATGYTASEIAGMLGYNTAKAVGNAAYRARRVIRDAETARSERLKAKVDKRLGWNTPPDSFRAAEEYARRKLAILKSRNLGAAGYGEEYLVELTADTLRERQFSRRTIKTHEVRLYTAASV